MIKLNKSTTTPQTLSSPAVIAAKAKLDAMVKAGKNLRFKDFDSTLYGAQDVRCQLLEDQFDKCIFCECTLLDQDGGEVEHFHPKTAVRQDRTKGNTIKPAYYQLAYIWDNLSLSCHACNRRKSTFFPLKNPVDRFNLKKEIPLIINPYEEDPAKHIEFRLHKVFPTIDVNGNEDIEGSTTITTLGLNRPDLVELRKRHFETFIDNMTDHQLTFDEMLDKMKKDVISHHRSSKSIEFLGMYENQKYKF